MTLLSNSNLIINHNYQSSNNIKKLTWNFDDFKLSAKIYSRFIKGEYSKSQANDLLFHLCKEAYSGQNRLGAGRMAIAIAMAAYRDDKVKASIYDYCQTRYEALGLMGLTDFELWGLMNPAPEQDLDLAVKAFEYLKEDYPEKLEHIRKTFDHGDNLSRMRLRTGLEDFDCKINDLLNGCLSKDESSAYYERCVDYSNYGTESQKEWAGKFFQEVDRRIEDTVTSKHLQDLKESYSPLNPVPWVSETLPEHLLTKTTAFNRQVQDLLNGRLIKKDGIELFKSIVKASKSGTDPQNSWAKRLLAEIDRRIESKTHCDHLIFLRGAFGGDQPREQDDKIVRGKFWDYRVP